MSDESSFVDIVENSAHGGYYLFVGNTLATLILFISSIVVAQLLGPDSYGSFSLIIAVPSIIIGLLEFGMTATVTKFLAEYKSNGKTSSISHVIKISMVLVLILGLIGTIICFFFSQELSTYLINTPEASNYVKLASVLILFQSLFNVISSIFVGLDKMHNNAFIMIIRAVTKLLISTVLVFFGLSISGAMIGHILCYVIAVSVGLLLIILKLNKKIENGDPNSDILKSMLKYGLPIYGAGLLGLLSTQYQTIIAAFFVSKVEIGNFQVNTLFQTILTTIIYPFMALFPAFSKLDPKSFEFKQFFKRSVKYTSLLLVPCSLAIIVLANNLVYAFYGPEYTLASTYVTFNTLFYLFSGIGASVFSYLFNGIRRTDVILKSSLISLAVFTPLAPLFTMQYGVIGLIVANLIAQVCSLLYKLFIALRKVNLTIDWSSALKIYAASLISAILTFLSLTILPFNEIINLVLGCTIFILSYLTVMPVIGLFTATDIEIFRIQFQKIKSIWPIVKLVLQYETTVLNYVNKHKKKKY